MTLEVPPPEVPYHLEPDPTITLSVVYEDDDLLIVDKPAGLVVHPAPGHWQGTLVNALLARGDHYGGIAGVARPGIVHRLDRDTSGLLIVARNDAAQASLMAQIKGRRDPQDVSRARPGIRRRRAVGRIEAPIGRDPKDRKRMAVVTDGRRAVDGLPGPRAIRGLDAPRAGPDHRAHPPDPRPPDGPRPSGRGRPGLRDGHVAARVRTASSGCSSTRGGWSWCRRRARKLVRAEAPIPPALESVLESLRAGEASAGRRPLGAA